MLMPTKNRQHFITPDPSPKISWLDKTSALVDFRGATFFLSNANNEWHLRHRGTKQLLTTEPNWLNTITWLEDNF